MASTEELQERYARIQRKEEELRQRESVLREQQLGIDEDREPNWPSCCPLVYHNIAEEIPMDNQTVVKVAFYLQFLWWACLIFNLFASFGVSSMKKDKDYPFARYIVFSIIYTILGIPLAFRINYMKFYEQCKLNDLGGCWFILELIFLAINVYAAVGLPESGCAGVLLFVDAISSESASGYLKVLSIITTVLLILSSCGQAFIGGRAFILYKSMGVSAATGEKPKPLAAETA